MSPGQPCELRHQLKALRADRRQLFDFGKIVLLPGQAQICQRYRIEIVIGQRDEAKAEAPQGYDFVDYFLVLPLPCASE